jgi:hypothetical protein
VASYLRDFVRKHQWLPEPVKQRVPPDFAPLVQTLLDSLGVEVQPLKDWANDPHTVEQAPTRSLAQKMWYEKLLSLSHKDWMAAGTHRDICRKTLLTPTAGAWMNSLPSAPLNTMLEHCDYRLALQWWMGIEIIPVTAVGATCAQCPQPLDSFGDHAVSCRANGITARHGAIQDWLLHTARAAGIQCSRESSLEDNTRPGDVLFHHWAGKGPLAIDVTCVHPLRPSAGRPEPATVRKFLLDTEQAKRTKYTATCAEAGWAFQPLVTHPFAGLTSDGAQFMHRLSRLYAENSVVKPTKSERVSLFWQSFACTVVREVAAQLRLTTFTGPQGPTLPSPVIVDDAGNALPLAHAWRGAGGASPRGRRSPQPAPSMVASSSTNTPYR